MNTCCYCMEDFEHEDPEQGYCSELCSAEDGEDKMRAAYLVMRRERDEVIELLREGHLVPQLREDDYEQRLAKWLEHPCSICRRWHGREIEHERE